ncbi:hypothetical protein JST97_17675 [bacterium]|nr:hypothetical protein [bacterium]
MESSEELRALCLDLSRLAGVSPDCREWLLAEVTPPTRAAIESHSDMHQLLSSLLVRLIGMEVDLP